MNKILFHVSDWISISSPTAARFTRSSIPTKPTKKNETQTTTDDERKNTSSSSKRCHIYQCMIPASTYAIELIMVEQIQDKTNEQQTKTTGKNSFSTQLSRKSFFPKIKIFGKRFRKAKQERVEKKVCCGAPLQRNYNAN